MKKIFFIFLLFVFLASSTTGQNDTIDIHYGTADPLHRARGLFDSEELMELTLQFDISTFQRKKSSEEYLPALLTFHLAENDSVNNTVMLRARGNNRKTVCSFPPIRLNFKKGESSDSEFADIDKIKMVTHCDPGNLNYTLKEYLAYKLYNVLTEYSYKVRLARIKYINTARKNKAFSEYAFFIEPAEMLCKRLNAVEVENIKLTQRNILPEVMDQMAIFHYMIGNTDWSVPIYHNVTVLHKGLQENSNLGIIIPYDFDHAGLINASYALPYEGLGLKSVIERKYLGICRSREVYSNRLKVFPEKKEEFIRVIKEFPYLSEKTKKEMIAYLETFFRDFDKPNIILNKFLSDCITL
jgi:hypothetical protein